MRGVIDLFNYLFEVLPQEVIIVVPAVIVILTRFEKKVMDLGRWTPLIPVVIGLVLGVVSQLAYGVTSFKDVYDGAIFGVVLGALAGMGFDIYKFTIKGVQTKVIKK